MYNIMYVEEETYAFMNKCWRKGFLKCVCVMCVNVRAFYIHFAFAGSALNRQSNKDLAE